MSNTSGRAEEVLNKKQGTKSGQRWAHASLNNEEEMGAHWNSCSRRVKQMAYNSSEGHDPETPSALQDHKQRNPKEIQLHKTEARPRSKNRRPDVAVYVPRGRRAQESTENEDNKEKDHSETHRTDSDRKDKTNKNKTGMGVYVPRPRRLQQSTDTKHEEQDEGSESCHYNSVEEQAGARTNKSKKIKKHVHKEKTSDDCDMKGDSKVHDSSKTKHKHKSKSSRHDRKPFDEETEPEIKQQEVNNVMNLQNVDVRVDNMETVNLAQRSDIDNNDSVECNETWEDELKFYSNVDEVVENADNVEKSPDCLDEFTGNHSAMVADQEVPMKEETTQSMENASPKKHDIEISTLKDDNVLCSEKPPPSTNDDKGLLEKPTKYGRISEEDTEKHSSRKSQCTQAAIVPGNYENENDSLKVDESSHHKVQSDGAKEQSNPPTQGTSDTREGVVHASEDDIGKNEISEDISGSSGDTATPKCSVQLSSSQIPEGGNNATPVNMETEDDGEEDTWDSLFADDGEALDPKLMDELTAAVGKVTVQKPQFDYYNYQPKDPDLEDEAYGHLVEIYDFPSELITRDLVIAFKEYKDRGFDIKWVDDNHAIGIFSSPIAAQSVLGMKHPLMKVRPISQASRETKLKAKKCGSFMEPYRPRPETTAAVARSLVTGALGLKSTLTREQRDAERRKLKEAKEKRRMERQQKKDAWDGSYGKCAMDDA